ncbi:MAG: DNA alkylation repair protein [Rickettsiales bacterium]|jgi:3-methyladenine DNA glycosylase AlkD|nr:DNA alkylation repair protein [Rickettsiales bacterium]
MSAGEIVSELKSAGGDKKFSEMTLGYSSYGSGDEILGVSVPAIRAIYKKYKPQIQMGDVEKLLYSEIHEARFLALLAMIDMFPADEGEIVRLYLRALDDGKVNNWDLVDLSSHKIIGRHCLENNDTVIMNELAKANDLWKNRVAMVSCWHFVRNDRPEIVLDFARKLKNHPHHLIHKAMGWMLREAWKKTPASVEDFLAKNDLPKITVSYATELQRKKHKQAS